MNLFSGVCWLNMYIYSNDTNVFISISISYIVFNLNRILGSWICTFYVTEMCTGYSTVLQTQGPRVDQTHYSRTWIDLWWKLELQFLQYNPDNWDGIFETTKAYWGGRRQGWTSQESYTWLVPGLDCRACVHLALLHWTPSQSDRLFLSQDAQFIFVGQAA